MLHPDFHAGSLGLWLKMVDAHFEIEKGSDCDGQQRHELYREVLNQFIGELKSNEIEPAAAHFNQWLRRRFNEFKGVSVNREVLKGLLKQVQESDGELSPQEQDPVLRQ